MTKKEIVQETVELYDMYVEELKYLQSRKCYNAASSESTYDIASRLVIAHTLKEKQ